MIIRDKQRSQAYAAFGKMQLLFISSTKDPNILKKLGNFSTSSIKQVLPFFSLPPLYDDT